MVCIPCIFCVSTSEVAIIEQFGKFDRVGNPGVNCYIYPCEVKAGTLSYRVQQIDVRVETKTKDNVFINAVVSVQYQVLKSKIYEAFYALSNPTQQITAHIYDVMRAELPNLDLDSVFEAKEDLAMAVKNSLSESFSRFGYQIIQALITDLDPDQRVKNAMNEINSSKRLKFAVAEQAEGAKILQVKSAEAEAESKYLSGVGVAKQRKAIVDGLRHSIVDFSDGVKGASNKDVMDLLLMTQYFDMVNSVGSANHCKTVFLPSAKSSNEELRTSLMQASA